MAKQHNYSTTKSQFVQNDMKEGATKEQANRHWKKSDERRDFENNNFNQHPSDESDFDSDINGNGTNWHTSEDL